MVHNPAFVANPGTPVEMAAQYIRENRAFYRLTEKETDELVPFFTRTSAGGITVRFRQHFGGLPVFGSEIAVTLDHNRTVRFVAGNLVPAVHLDNLSPAVTAKSALEFAVATLKVEGALSFDRSTLTIFQEAGNSRLAWLINLVPSFSPPGDWEVLCDARTGELIRVRNRAYHATVDGSGYVFDPDPLSSAGATYGGSYVDDGDATNSQLDAERFSVTLRDITLIGGTYSLAGPYAEITDFESPFNGLFTQGSSTFNFSRQDDPFEAVNCYYHIDHIMRYINETLGLVIMPYQYSGGVRFDPHGYNGADNSHYLSSNGSLAYGEGGVDDAEDADVIIHELGHGIHDWVTGGGLSQVNGLSEGFGDYLAMSYSRSLGHWGTGDPQYNWVFVWDGHNPFWGGRKTDYGATWPDGLIGHVHTDGQIWSTCLLKIWGDIGREKTDRACLEGLAMTGSSSNQEDAARAVLQAAINMNYSKTDLVAMASRFEATGYKVGDLVATGVAGGGRPALADKGESLSSLAASPNPFRGNTRLAYTVSTPSGAPVNIAVYDVTGRRVRQLLDTRQGAGSHEITWNGLNDAGESARSGIYFYRAAIGDEKSVIRITLLR